MQNAIRELLGKLQDANKHSGLQDDVIKELSGNLWRAVNAIESAVEELGDSSPKCLKDFLDKSGRRSNE